uniref:EGF-like domain-containing protein n=1 Tax=Rhizochromulina marina TaxID=1034831 RepID=A0A7S2RQC4_9STRA
MSHGVCDGFGTCQCAPPFLGKDCSIKDCPDNCNYNGWCSVEYPVSRCVCNPTYFGETCQYTECLNNCSFPNGVCDYATGECKCQRLYSPYNNTRVFRTDWGVEATWEGEDCSWLTAYSAAPASRRPARLGLLLAWPLFMAAVLLLSAFLGKAAPHYELPPVSPELVREAMLARELRIHSVGPGDHTEK